MKVRKIAVKGLFGIFDHEIPLQSAERVTIIHGPNGFGKTVILRMIADLAAGKRAIFEHTPFEEFSATLDDGTARKIRRLAIRDAPSATLRVKLELSYVDLRGKETAVALPTSTNVPKQYLKLVDRKVPGLALVGSEWADGEGKKFSLEEVLERFPAAGDVLPKEFRPGHLFEDLRDLEVFFVETNRLSSQSSSHSQQAHEEILYPNWISSPRTTPTIPRVREYSDDIVQRIKTVLTDYARYSQDRDRTFPERLVRFIRDRDQTLPEREILGRMAELESKRRRLISLALLDKESGLRDLTEEEVRKAPEALTIYVADIGEKLSVFDELARRIGALMDIVNSRFRYKRLTIKRDRGFRVFSQTNQPIELEDLSSGEQNELIVLYELLFRGPESGLVLVDEPEISLHVAWQSRFLADLISILEHTDAYAIVATHSPVIIGTRTDLTVQLQGPEIPAEVEGQNARAH